MKFKEIQKLEKQDREKKLKDLKMELVKSKIDASRKGSSKTRDIKKIIARIYTLNKSERMKLKNK